MGDSPALVGFQAGAVINFSLFLLSPLFVERVQLLVIVMWPGNITRLLPVGA